MLNKLHDRIIEFLKFDNNEYKFPLVAIICTYICILHLLGRKKLAFSITSTLYRTGWKGSYTFGLYYSRKILNNNNLLNEIVQKELESIEIKDNTKKIHQNPKKMLNGIVTVLKSPRVEEKGAILINYSYYFLLFHLFFNVKEISKHYNIILEPSWAGFCEVSIFSYSIVPDNVYIMCYEKRDYDFISQIKKNFIPINIGPSWFVNHNKFHPENVERDFDIVMVAAWAKFKRHRNFFKAISGIDQVLNSPKIALVGYPVDLRKEDILKYAKEYNLSQFIEFYEWITPDEVSKILSRSKISVLWSRFEGNNRAIIEGMFCNNVVILREDHNYGDKYDFINNETGSYANESNLLQVITEINENFSKFNPRKYVINNRNCVIATEIMNKLLSKNEENKGRKWSENLAVKVNELHKMDYLDPGDRNRFHQDYEYLSSQIKQPLSFS